MRRSLWYRTLRNRTTLGWYAGAAVILILFSAAHWIDPRGTRDYSAVRGWVFFGHVVVATFYVNYRLESGAWTLNTWGRMLHPIVNLPSFSLVGWYFASIPKYWPAGAFIFFSSSITYLGIYGWRGYLLPVLSFALVFFGSLALWLPQELAEHWLFHVLCWIGVYTYMIFIGRTSVAVRQQNDNTFKLLRRSRRDKRTIAEERKKSDRLLLNILPAKIADELKQTGSNPPVHFDAATVLFTDFQGFTRIAENMTPGELIEELDRCFSYFDSLMDRHKLEKLKTIGDSFMCAGGLPEPNRTHAVDAVLAALEIQSFMNQMKEIKAAQNLPYWELRLGIHTGPLVAGVIGEKKFAYDVWGDTVNTASRCESSGAAGRINISSATQALVAPFFDCEHRGRVPAKHKGEIDMYFVNGIRPELSREGTGKVPDSGFQKLYAEL